MSKLNNKHGHHLSSLHKTISKHSKDRQSIYNLGSEIADRDLSNGTGVLASAKRFLSGDISDAVNNAPFLYDTAQTAVQAGIDYATGTDSGAAARLGATALSVGTQAAKEAVAIVKRIFTDTEFLSKAMQQIFDERVGAREDFLKMSFLLGRVKEVDSEGAGSVNDWIHDLKEAKREGPKMLIREVRKVTRSAAQWLREKGITTKVSRRALAEEERALGMARVLPRQQEKSMEPQLPPNMRDRRQYAALAKETEMLPRERIRAKGNTKKSYMGDSEARNRKKRNRSSASRRKQRRIK
jgi:hypothetical protein